MAMRRLTGTILKLHYDLAMMIIYSSDVVVTIWIYKFMIAPPSVTPETSSDEIPIENFEHNFRRSVFSVKCLQKVVFDKPLVSD